MGARYTFAQLGAMADQFTQQDSDVTRTSAEQRLIWLIAGQDLFCELVPGTYTKPAGWSVSMDASEGFVQMPTNSYDWWPTAEKGAVLASVAGKWTALEPTSKSSILTEIGGPSALDVSIGSNVGPYAAYWWDEGDGYLRTYPFVAASTAYKLFRYGSPSGADLPSTIDDDDETGWETLYSCLLDADEIALAHFLAHCLEMRELPTGDEAELTQTEHGRKFLAIATRRKGKTMTRRGPVMRSHARGM